MTASVTLPCREINRNAAGTPSAYVSTRMRTTAPASVAVIPSRLQNTLRTRLRVTDEADRHADDAAGREIAMPCEHAEIDVRVRAAAYLWRAPSVRLRRPLPSSRGCRE